MTKNSSRRILTMRLNIHGKKLTIIVIVIFVIASMAAFFVDWVDENVTNPRIWKDWTCEKMKQFAIRFEDEMFADFQRAKFHEDLSLCMSS